MNRTLTIFGGAGLLVAIFFLIECPKQICPLNEQENYAPVGAHYEFTGCV